MNKKFATGCLIAGALLLPVATYAADSDMSNSQPGAFVKDSVITASVKTQLGAEKVMSLIHIHVDTDRNGVVYLSGTAPSHAAIDKAVSIASSVKGVASVHNEILVKSE
jgi:hyperosmotically inducible protein